jgi:hypothetical protein
LRERFLLGSNKNGMEAVIPFWHRGRIKGLIRRRLNGHEPKYVLPKAEDLVDGHRPLFVPGPIRGDTFAVEGYVDALAVASLGESVVAIGGTDASEKQMDQLRRLSVERLYVLPDADENGAGAARAWARLLYPRAMICKADYGGEGCNDFADLFASAGADAAAEHLMRLVEAHAEDLIDIETEIAGGLGSARQKLAYVTEHIIPLVARVPSESARIAELDVVAKQLNLTGSWLKKALNEEFDRREREQMAQFMRQIEEEKRRQREEHLAKVAAHQDEIDALLGPGVLERLRETAAGMHDVKGDREALELSLLVALGAQLAPLPNGRPLGASMLLTANAGRGKNHLADAAVKPLPPEFYLTFEIASGQSLYYAAAEDPAFLKHKFVYPNEIEGVEALIEFLRPMLSKGWCKKFVTNKDSNGRNVIQEIMRR